VVNFVGGLHAVHFRHDNVEHDDIRVNLTNSIQSYLTIFSFVDFPVRLLRKKQMQGMSDESLIVYEKDCGGCWQARFPSKTRSVGTTSVLPLIRYVSAFVSTIGHTPYFTDKSNDSLQSFPLA